MTAMVDSLLDRHLHALRAVSDALLERTVVEGYQIAWLREGRRCVCHPFIDHSVEDFPTSVGAPAPEPVVSDGSGHCRDGRDRRDW